MGPFISKVPIHLGWSTDEKYEVTTEDGTTYFLRVTRDKGKFTRVEKGFRLQEALEKRGLSMPKPIALESNNEAISTFFTWVRGEAANTSIPQMPIERQYDYGIEAGKQLSIIHSIPIEEDEVDWQTRFHAKMDRNIRKYHECPIQFEGSDRVIAYIDANRHLLVDRPQTFQHGDYHIGNMMIENEKLIIIDFDRYDVGDPWEEFNRIVWCAQASPAFASGMVDGYFDGKVPQLFWELLALYISSNMLSSFPWALSFGEAEVSTMTQQAKQVLSWYDHMDKVVPTWYHEHES